MFALECAQIGQSLQHTAAAWSAIARKRTSTGSTVGHVLMWSEEGQGPTAAA